MNRTGKIKNGITEYYVNLPSPESPVLLTYTHKHREARSMEEQENILTKVCPSCRFGMWNGSFCLGCSGEGCFSNRVATKNMHCPKGEW